MEQSQEEFYFSLPHHLMDLCLHGRDHDVPLPDLAAVVGLDTAQVERVMRDIDQKRRSTRYLHAPPVLVEEISQIDG